MICPKCKKSDTKVIDSRDIENCVRRRRECLECGFRFTTYEKIELVNFTVLKKDNNKEEYDRIKIRKGISIACNNRPINDEAIDELVDKVECRLLEKGSSIIETKVIGKCVLEELKKIDKVAYLRFASVHKKFASPERFGKELKKIR